MNFNQLRFAAAAAAATSFSRAAEHCQVTQPTLSNGIAQLEEELGDKLFARTTRRVELTPFGEQMIPRIEAILQAQGEVLAAAQTYVAPTHQRLRVGLSPLIDTRLLNHVVEPYRKAYPDTDIFFREIFLDDLEGRLRKGQIDVMFRPYLSWYHCPRDFTKIIFYEEDFYYLPNGETTAPITNSKVYIKDIADELIIISHEGCGLASATRQLFAEVGLHPREYNTQTMSPQVMMEWADLGVGAAILPKSRISLEYREKAKPLMLTSSKQAQIRIEGYWMKAPAYTEHVTAFHRHLHDRGPTLIDGYLDG